MSLYPDQFIGTIHPYVKMQVFLNGKMLFETPSWPMREENETYLKQLCQTFIITNYLENGDWVIQREEHHQKYVYTRLK